MNRAGLVAAGGRGLRLGSVTPKALCEVSGVPLVVRAVRALDDSGLLTGGVVVAPPDHRAEVAAAVRAAELSHPWDVIPGGATRQESVGLGLAAPPTDVDVVLVHDAARPFVPTQMVRRVVAAVDAGADAAVPVVPLADTVKQVADGDVLGTPDRSGLRQVQTPQAFRRATLEEAHRLAGADATDDAALVERVGGRVVAVDGDPLAFKVTGGLDLLLAEAVAGQQGAPRPGDDALR